MNRGLDFCMDIFDFTAMPESVVRRDFMFEPKLETTYGESGHRYDLIGPETTPCYRAKKSVIRGKVERKENTFFTGIVTDGECIVRTGDHEIKVETYGKFFCPAELGEYSIESENGVQILECFPPA